MHLDQVLERCARWWWIHPFLGRLVRDGTYREASSRLSKVHTWVHGDSRAACGLQQQWSVFCNHANHEWQYMLHQYKCVHPKALLPQGKIQNTYFRRAHSWLSTLLQVYDVHPRCLFYRDLGPREAYINAVHWFLLPGFVVVHTFFYMWYECFWILHRTYYCSFLDMLKRMYMFILWVVHGSLDLSDRFVSMNISNSIVRVCEHNCKRHLNHTVVSGFIDRPLNESVTHLVYWWFFFLAIHWCCGCWRLACLLGNGLLPYIQGAIRMDVFHTRYTQRPFRVAHW